MPILNLDKLKKNKEEPKEAVPDELPPLPEAKKEPNPQPVVESKPVMATAQVQQPSQQNQVHPQQVSLAPDELPPLNVAEPQQKQPSPSLPSSPVQQMKEQKEPPKIVDEKTAETNLNPEEHLFFTDLMSRFLDKSTNKFVEDTIVASASSEVIATLGFQWEEKKLLDSLAQIEKKIIETLTPMQQIEMEWRKLKDEILVKETNLQEIESKISSKTALLKNLIQEKNRLQSEIMQKRNS